MKPYLEKAILLAATAHKGQVDKAGEPYILHPLRLMMRVEGVVAKTAAVLHDIVEDTDWTFAALREEGFPTEVVTALEYLTKKEGESYADFIKRAQGNPVAARVKLADLEDNLDITRIAQPTAKDFERLAKYHEAWRYLAKKGE